MTDLFLSYSSHDRNFALRLGDALERAGQEIWVDWKSIRAGEPWVESIQEGVAKANAFVLVLSPEAVASPEVQREIAWASEANKRIITIRYRQVEWRKLPEGAREIQWLSIADDAIEAGVRELLICLNTDLEWERHQTRLHLRATAWRKGSPPVSTLRGTELEAAEAWLAAGRPTTELIRDYIATSRRTVNIESAQRLLVQSQTSLNGPARKIVESALQAAQAGKLWVSHDCDDVLRARLRLLPRLVAVLPHSLPVRRMTFSEDSMLLATESGPLFDAERSTRRVWSIATSEEVESDAAALLDASPYRAIFSSADKALRFVEVSTGEEILSFDGVERDAYELTRDRLTVRMAARAAVWSLATRRCLAEAKGQVGAIALSEDATTLAVAYGSSLQLRAAATGETLRIIEHDSAIRVIEFNGDRIAVGCDDGSCRVWIVNGTEVARLMHNLPVGRLAFNRSGEWIATFADVVFEIEDNVRVWDLRPSPPPISSGWTQCEFDGTSTAVVIAGRRAERLDFSGSSQPRAANAPKDVELAFYAADAFCVLAGEKLWRLDGAARKAVWSIDRVTDTQCGETHCVLTRSDKSMEIVQIWDGKRTWAHPPIPIGDDLAAKLVAMLGDTSGVLAAHPYALSPDSRYLSVTVPSGIQIVDAYTGEVTREFAREKQSTSGFVWSPRGGYIAAAFPTRFGVRIKTALERSTDNTSSGTPAPGLFILHVSTGTQIEFSNKEICETLTFSSDEALLAAGSIGGGIHVWNVESRSEVRKFHHGADAKCVCFSSDGRWLASGGADGIARVWDLNTGLEAAWFRCRAEIRRLNFSGDGEFVYTFDASGEIWRWAIAPQSALLAEEVRRRCRQELQRGVASHPLPERC